MSYKQRDLLGRLNASSKCFLHRFALLSGLSYDLGWTQHHQSFSYQYFPAIPAVPAYNPRFSDPCFNRRRACQAKSI